MSKHEFGNGLGNVLKARLVHLAYSVNNRAAYAFELGAISKPLEQKGWQELYCSSHNVRTQSYGYKAIAFYNESAKKIHIAIAGTDTSDAWDGVDNVSIFFGMVPWKFISAKNMIGKIEDSIKARGYNIHDFTFSTSGHSLGAVVSDLTAAELISRKVNFENSVTYENLGSGPIIERAMKLKLFSAEVGLKEVASKLVVHNAKPNFMNSMHPQIGEVHLLITEGASKIQQTKLGFWNCWSYFLDKISEQIQNHRLANFTEKQTLCKLGYGKWDLDSNGRLIVDKKSVKSITTSSGNECSVHGNVSGIGYTDLISFTVTMEEGDVQAAGALLHYKIEC